MFETLDKLSGRLSARHQAAVEVLRYCDRELAPLVLYLRKFSIHNMHGKTAADRKFGEDGVLEHLPDEARILTIQEDQLGEEIRSTYNSHIPALSLVNLGDWKEIIAPLIARSELIFSEFTFLSSGVRWELETCRALNKHHQTVLILPPRSCEYSCLDHLSPLDQFPRVIWADQLHRESIGETFVAADLFGRVSDVAGLARSDRKALYSDGSSLNGAPVDYESVLAGYQARAQSWEVRAALGDSQSRGDLDYYSLLEHRFCAKWSGFAQRFDFLNSSELWNHKQAA